MLSAANLSTQVTQLEDQLNRHIAAWENFQTDYPNCMKYKLQDSTPSEGAKEAEFFAKNMRNFSAEIADIQEKSIQISEQLRYLSQSDSSQEEKMKIVTPEIANRVTIIAIKTVTCCLKLVQ